MPGTLVVPLPTGVVSGCASPSVLANVISQQKKASGVENIKYLQEITLRNIKPIDSELFKTRTMSSLCSASPNHIYLGSN